MVWEQALEERERPGVQFFTFTPDDVPEGENVTNFTGYCDMEGKYKCKIHGILGVSLFSDPDHYIETRYHTSTPQLSNRSAPKFSVSASGSASPSWFGGNPSSYLIEAGLWGACRESRAVVERKWAQCVNFKEYGNCSLSAYLNHGAAKNMFTIRRHDLVCLQFAADSVKFEADEQSPSWNDVAIEIDPRWRVPVSPSAWPGNYSILDASAIAAGRLANLSASQKRLWLIDYRIKRVAGTTIRPDRIVFYGLDRRYIQIHEDDDEWESKADAFSLARDIQLNMVAMMCPGGDRSPHRDGYIFLLEHVKQRRHYWDVQVSVESRMSHFTGSKTRYNGVCVLGCEIDD